MEIVDNSGLIYQFTIGLIFLATVIFYLSMFFYSKRLTTSVIKQKKAEQDLLISNLNLQNERIEKDKIRLAELAERERAKRLEQERDLRSKELVSNTLLFQKQVDLLLRLDENLKEIPAEDPSKAKVKLNKLRRLIKSNLNQEDTWDEFKIQFEKLHPSFFEKLKTSFPKLTANDLRHCAFMKMRMNTKEIARLLNINPTSVQISRVRMKKKMNLGAEEDLKQFIAAY
ncbi:helix-turn-helix transcriptional regulator [Portibacter marinus]|uniref:helix-turn-helix transcriptional regulator n=1 Tax=Portibacter marinus TaxID=2898660 RepID=UPI001F28FF00|nr:hypothetical protein [Portibacter marinus]